MASGSDQRPEERDGTGEGRGEEEGLPHEVLGAPIRGLREHRRRVQVGERTRRILQHGYKQPVHRSQNRPSHHTLNHSNTTTIPNLFSLNHSDADFNEVKSIN